MLTCREVLDEFGPRFPDMSCAFDKELRALAHDCAKKQGFTLRPVWAVRVLARYHDGFEIMTHVLLDAATGQAL